MLNDTSQQTFQDSFSLSTEMDFSASHILHGHTGKCGRLHGHNWKVEVKARTETLNSIGIGIDFQDLKSALRPIIDYLDHYHLNDLPEFQTHNPTAENVSKFIYWALRKNLPPEIKLDAVTLWETDRSSVCYRPIF